jgi:hypothetical protein
VARAIDTIAITDALRQRVPGLAIPFRGNGVQVILDPDDPTDVSETTGKVATILRPDGSTATWTIAGSEVRHRVPAIFFEGMSAGEVPRLSEITW